MSTFFMFGKYSSDSLKEPAENWTRRILEIIRHFDGDVQSMYSVMGAYDLVLIANFHMITQALQASVAITKEQSEDLRDYVHELQIAFSTLPAIPVEEFDKLVGTV